jgi:hypothetical protein
MYVVLVVLFLVVFSCSNACVLKQAKVGGAKVSWCGSVCAVEGETTWRALQSKLTVPTVRA